MPISDDPWIAKNSPIPAEMLHALGPINFYWNRAEMGLRALLAHAMRIELVKLWPLVHEMGDVAISNSIREVISRDSDLQNYAEAIEYGLQLYEINRLNRNQLTHYLPQFFADTPFARMKGPRFDPQPVPGKIEDIRRAADEVQVLLGYLGPIMFCLGTRVSKPKWPEKPPLPERLWKPPLPNPQGRTAPPETIPG